jgi:hypothetical protein
VLGIEMGGFRSGAKDKQTVLPISQTRDEMRPTGGSRNSSHPAFILTHTSHVSKISFTAIILVI